MANGLSYAVNKFFAYSIPTVGVIGVIGNVLVILAILGSAKMRATAMNTFLVNMAFADLLFIVTLAMAWVPYFYNDNWLWIWPPFLCRPYNYFNNAMLHISMLTYDAISIERYLVICHPMSYTTSTMGGASRSRIVYRNLGIIAAIWGVVALFDIPTLYEFLIVSRTANGTTTNQCFNAPGALWLDIHRWVTAIALFFISLILTIVLYTKICRVLWSVDKTIYKRERVVGAKAGTSAEDSQPTQPTRAKSEASKKQEEALTARRAVVKMMIICVSVFFACYTPSFIGYILVNIFDTRLFAELTPISILLFTICSSVNPFIYTLFSAKIRARISSLLQLKKWLPGKKADVSTTGDTGFHSTAQTATTSI